MILFEDPPFPSRLRRHSQTQPASESFYQYQKVSGRPLGRKDSQKQSTYPVEVPEQGPVSQFSLQTICKMLTANSQTLSAERNFIKRTLSLMNQF